MWRRNFLGVTGWEGGGNRQLWLRKNKVTSQSRLYEGTGLDRIEPVMGGITLSSFTVNMGDGFIYSSTGWKIASFFIQTKKPLVGLALFFI